MFKRDDVSELAVLVEAVALVVEEEGGISDMDDEDELAVVVAAIAKQIALATYPNTTPFEKLA